MSGGQMRRASLAIGIALNPGILLLDEPTANLDIATRREIMAVLEDMKARDEIFALADVAERVGIRPPEIFSMAQALDRRAMCYTIDEFLSSFQEV